jgi:hypothetical protein
MGAIIVSFTKSPQSLPFFLKVHRLLIPVKSPNSIWWGQVTQGVIRFSRDSLWEFLARTLKGAVSSLKRNTVNDVPALASEPVAASRCKPEAGFETHELFEVDYSFAKQSHSGRLA